MKIAPMPFILIVAKFCHQTFIIQIVVINPQ